MSCVNTKSIEFKRLLEETNISSSTLELLIHKIWNSEGSERIPTAEEITNLLKPKEFTGNSDIVELWDKYYSKPISFTNVSSAYETYEKACVLFGEDSVSIIERKNGTFDIVVGNPTSKVEADYILSKAERDSEGHLLAPNGQVSHLSEEQYVQVRTKAFKDWFGDWEKDPDNASKVVDENGEPLAVYHTGAEDIEIFKTTLDKVEEIDPLFHTQEERISLLNYLLEKGYKITEQQKENFIKDSKKIAISKSNAIYTTDSKEMSSSYGEFTTKKEKYDYFEKIRSHKIGILKDELAVEIATMEATKEYKKFLEAHPGEFNSILKKAFEQILITRYEYKIKEIEEIPNPVVLTENNANDAVGQYQLFVNSKNPLIVDAEGNNWNMIQYHGNIESTRSLEKYARGNGYTGIIVKNVYDYGGGSATYGVMTPNTVVAVFDANQVKSVENNGDFSSENDNIYFENEDSNSNNYSEREFTIDNPSKDTRLQELYNKGLKEKVTISDLYNLLKSSEYQDILDILAKLSKGRGYFLGDIKVKIEIPTLFYDSITKTYSNSRYKNRRAYYDAATKTIYINANANYTNGNSNSVIMHEIMHALTVDRILNNDNLKQEFLKLINEYREAFPNEYWELTNEHFIEEFIADVWSKKSTIEKLKKLQYKGDKHKSSLWDKIVNFFKSILFKGAVKDSMFEQASNLLVDLLNQDVTTQNKETFYENETPSWGRTAENSYEVSTAGDSRFSALNAKFNPGTIIEGVDVGGKTIEDVYQSVIKKSGKGKAPAKDSKLYRAPVKSYSGDITPDADTIFVFGSNPEGRHGAGAAKVAVEKFGAIKGQGEGLQGNSYALPTKDLRVSENNSLKSTSEKHIIESIEKLYDTARQNPDKQFKIAYRNTTEASLNGYTGLEMIDMFLKAGTIPSNIVFSKEWVDTGKFDLSKEALEDLSYTEDYLPLWQEWAKQNPELIQELKEKSMGKTLTDKFTNTKISQARALADIISNTNKSLEDYYTFNTDVEYSSKKDLNGSLGRTRQGKITIATDVTIDDFFNYSKGKENSVTSKQKAKVFELLATEYGYTEEYLRNLIETNEDAQKLILYHELSHKYWEDNPKEYYKGDERDSSGKLTKVDYLAPNKIEVELRATVDAIRRLEKEKSEQLNSSAKEKKNKDQESSTITEENKSFTKKMTTVTQQINNLTETTILSSTETRHIAEQVVWWISDHITELQETPGLIAQIYGEQYKDKDLSSMSRVDIVKLIGPDNIIAMCKEKFSPENTDYEDFNTIEKADLITDNWEAIILLANDEFLNLEEFSITSTRDGKTREVIEDITPDADNFNDSNEEGEVLEKEGDLQEHWQIETKTLDIIATMSQLVKRALRQCYVLDNNGNKVTSEFGINERINMRTATNSILRWTQGALTLEQMITKLQEKTQNNPWVKQLIDRLSDTSGKETDFQSQFFSTFSKHFQTYSVVVKENGKYVSKIVNVDSALKDAMTQVTTQFKINEHPLFTSEGINKKTFNELKKAFEELKQFKSKSSNKDITEEVNKKEAAETLGFISNLLGYYITPEIVAENLDKNNFNKMYSALQYIIKNLEKNLDNKTYDPFTFRAEGSIIGNTREFLRPITEYFENNTIAAFYDSGKMYQSYITPSYTTKLFQKFGLSGKAFDDFITKEYCCTEWFHTGNDIEKGWKNEWLRELVTSNNARQVFKHKVQLNFNKRNYMKNMNDKEYILSIITEYFSEFSKESQSRVPAWFRVPMLSNKPSSEFIRFYSERGFNYKDILVDKFKMIFDQELSRIQTVELRNKSKGDFGFIKNFDTNGRKFNFLDFMNKYLTGDKANSELGKLIRQKLNGLEIDEAQLNKLAKEAIKESMESRVEKILQEWESQGVLEASKSVSGIGNNPGEIKANIENFIWNDAFASMNIMQLTITDIAFYKDAEDLQKRLAQIHAPGIRANKDATDYKGNKVSDGYFRTAKLTDFDTFVSNIIDNVSIVFDRKIESAPESQKKALIALKESLVGEKGSFRQINVADAQGYSSPTSYRKKAFAFGKWSEKAEEVYNKLKEGTYTFSDLQIAFQPLKPFVYSQIEKSSGVSGSPIETFKTPVQFKNSEYLLIMADALLSGENTGKPNLLRAIYEVMENSHFDENGNYKADGIDTIQFESTTKSGLSGKIGLNDLVNDPNGEALAKARMEAAIYETVEKEITITNPETGKEETKVIYEKTGNYNNVAIDTVPFEDYCLQQEIPEHFKNHEQIFGSQSRFLLISELETLNYKGEPTYYEIDGKKVTAQELKAEYEELNAQNIQEKIEELVQEFSLDKVENVKDRNIALSKILQKEILSSPRYGIDLLQACSVDENGKFRIPLGDPIQSKRVEQLINSIIKNRINKQTMPGGPVVQVSNFGTSKELNIRFKDKDGKLLMTRAEYEKNPIKKISTQIDKFNARYRKQQSVKEEVLSYEDYIKENQAGIAYFEVFAPIYTNNLFSMFADKNGVINVKAIEMLDPDLLKMIGYRIPTEDKYSMAPLKIVGFLPREAGDGIMLPNDITLLTGSDFDIDKEYLMRKELKIDRNKISKSELSSILYNDLINSQSKKLSLETKNKISELIQEFLADPFDSSTLVNQKVANGFISIPEGAYNKMLQTYIQNAYSVVKPLEGREYRNNRILDIAYTILTHETSADKILNPGGFDQQKKMGYLVTAYRLYNNQYSWESLENMSISELKDLCNTNKNLSFIDTHIQFYKQNNAAGSLIGIFAVNRTAHAVLESSTPDGSASYYVDVDTACRLTKPFTVAGVEFGGVMPLDMRYDRNGQLIGKILGSLVASAADAVKDPILNLMNINGETANILNALVRMGMPFDDAALFLSQSVIADVLSDYYRENINGGVSLINIIQNKLSKISKTLQIDESSSLNIEELTKEELIEGLKLNSSDEIKYKTLKALSNFLNLSTALRMPTFATRFNSITSAVGPLIIDNLITEYKMEDLSLNSYIVDAEYNPVDINTIFMDHPILNQFRRGHFIANQLFGNMPTNSKGFRNILDSCDNNILNIFINDRKLLSNLSDFYQSYLLVKTGVINSEDLNYYITEFPKEFMSKNYKEQYKDNPFISAIRYNTDKEGRGVLQLNITGLDTAQKELFSSGWIDLHKSNPELSLKLFKYCFFRAGIGFSPKTFMSLVPTYVKERIPGYTDTFRMLPSVNPYIVLDQFIRNNWDNNKLVPRRSVAFSNLKNGHLEVSKESDVKSINNITYFKMKIDGQDKLFSVVSSTDNTVEIAEIDPLGNNKNYIEINENSMESSLEKKSSKTKEKLKQTNSEDSETSESEVVNTTTEITTDKSNNTEVSEMVLNDLLYKALVVEGVRTEEQAKDYVKNYKLRSEDEKVYFEKQVKRFLEKRFKILNIEYNEKTLDDIYKLMC